MTNAGLGCGSHRSFLSLTFAARDFPSFPVVCAGLDVSTSSLFNDRNWIFTVFYDGLGIVKRWRSVYSPREQQPAEILPVDEGRISYILHQCFRQSSLEAFHLSGIMDASSQPIQKPYRVLEIGCGEGHTTLNLLNEILPSHVQVTAVDTDAAIIRTAKARQ